MTIVSMSIDDAKALLMAEFPRLDWGNCNIVEAGNVLCFIVRIDGATIGVYFVPELGYRVQFSKPEISFFIQSAPGGDSFPTLAAAIAAIRQAKAQHLKALEVLG
jgi:hypothetical protein